MYQGMQETIALCGHVTDQIKKDMEDPHAIPAPIEGNRGLRLTPLQRALARDGTVFETMPKYEPTKAERKLPSILPFSLKGKKKYPSRKRTQTNIPL